MIDPLHVLLSSCLGLASQPPLLGYSGGLLLSGYAEGLMGILASSAVLSGRFSERRLGRV